MPRTRLASPRFCAGRFEKRSITLFAGKLYRQFFAADFLQGRKIGLRQLPHDGRGDAVVVVAQHVADARHFLPRDFGMTRFQLICEVAAGLGNNLDAALDEPLPLPIILENIEWDIPQHGTNPLDGLDDVRQAGNERTCGH